MATVENGHVGEGKQQLSLKNREKLILDGVLEVVSFDDAVVVLNTTQGKLTVEGEGLHVTKLLLDCGEIAIDGKIRSLCYEDSRMGGRGTFFRRLG